MMMLLKVKSNLTYDAEDIFEDVEVVVKNDPNNLEKKLYQSELNYNFGNRNKSKEIARLVLKQNSNDKKALTILSDTLLSNS